MFKIKIILHYNIFYLKKKIVTSHNEYGGKSRVPLGPNETIYIQLYEGLFGLKRVFVCLAPQSQSHVIQ